MDIRNVTQFVNFLSSNGLGTADTLFVQVTQCLHNYEHACNCYKKEDKMALYNACKRLYIDAVNGVVPKMKNVFLSKTTERQIAFYTDEGSLISILSR